MFTSSSHEGLVGRCLAEFTTLRPSLLAASSVLHQAVTARLTDDGLNYHVVQHRVKDIGSLERKLRRMAPDGSQKYGSGLDDIDDLVGLRVITYLEDDISRAMTALRGTFQQLEHVDKTSEQKSKGEFGYSGQHLVFRVGDPNVPPTCRPYIGLRFEVQFRTILQHAWAEFEHDVRYKGAGPVPPEVKRAFTLASGLIELADREFSAINLLVAAQRAADQAASDQAVAAEQNDELTAAVLQDLLEQALPEYPRSKTEHYEWLNSYFAANGVDTKSGAVEVLRDADWHFIAERMEYKFPAGQVRVVDDFLLEYWGEDYISRTAHLGADPNRADKLRRRLARLHGNRPNSTSLAS
jgi:putative GTP pyrophosphokinase